MQTDRGNIFLIPDILSNIVILLELWNLFTNLQHKLQIVEILYKIKKEIAHFWQHGCIYFPNIKPLIEKMSKL